MPYFLCLGNEDLFLVEGDLVCFNNNSLSYDKSDVLDSMLFSQLAADSRYNSSTGQTNSAEAWWHYYNNYVMTSLGWIIPTVPILYPGNPLKINTTRSLMYEMGQIVIRKISEQINNDQYTAKLTRLFNGLIKAGAGSEELTLFSQMHSKIRKDLLIVGVGNHGNGNTAIVLLGLEVDFDLSDVGKLLSPASQFDYKVAVLEGKLDMDIFNSMKKSVEQKLGDSLKYDIFPIKS